MENEIVCHFCGKHRSEVDQMIEGPDTHLGVIHVCNECIDSMFYTVHEDTGCEDNEEVKIYTPDEIKEYLDKYVIGQDDAKEAIAVAIYNHYKRILMPHPDDTEIDKSNLLLIGPSGSGKTLMVKTIAKLFELPYVIADATAMTESGYVGKDADTLIEGLIANARGDIEKAQKGIIFLDEIDKKSRKTEGASVNRDVSGEGVQQSLLKLAEGTVVTVQNPFGPPSDTLEFDTKDVLFICSGAFVGLPDIIKKSKHSTSIGIGAALKTNEKVNYMKHVMPDDLIKYGLIPEFVGRFPVTVVFDELTSEMMIKILKEPKNSIIAQYKALFKIDGVNLEFEDKYLQNVADESIKQKIGARGLRTIIEKHLQSTQFRLPAMAKSGINLITVEGNGNIKSLKENKDEK